MSRHHRGWSKRHRYEKRHYEEAYESGGDVDDMLRDYSHYVFSFHDQHVEALCAGIWFETADECLGTSEFTAKHPLADLPRPSEPEFLEGYGLRCEIRRNPLPGTDILKNAELCSQKLLQLALGDGAARADWTLAVRVRDGKVRSVLKNWFGTIERRYGGVASLADVRPTVMEWLRGVEERRRQRHGPGV